MNGTPNRFGNSIEENISSIIDDALNNNHFDELSRRLNDTVDTALNELRSSQTYKNAAGTLGRAVSKGVKGAGMIIDKISCGLGALIKGTQISKAPVNRKLLKKLPTVPVLYKYPLVAAIILMVVGTIFYSDIIVSAASALLLLGIIPDIIVALCGVRRRIKSRYRLYADEMERVGYIEIHPLAQRLGIKKERIIKELSTMLKFNVFEQGHLDTEYGFLLGTDELFGLYQNAINQRQHLNDEKVKRAEEGEEERQIREALETGERFINQIHYVNDILPEPEISKKLSETELIVSKIFNRLKEKPELLPQARKFIEYYLPITENLVNAYAKFEHREIKTQSIRDSQQEIKKSLDTVNSAFYKLYESLFEDEIIDINSDINVLRTMLAQEGLSDEGLRL